MKSPIVKVAIVFIAGILVSRIFWFLGFLPNAFKYIISPGNCRGYQTKTIQMYLCSASVAFRTLIGPILFMVLIFFFRKFIFMYVKKLKPLIPNEYHFVINPLVATLIFTILWSGSHYNTSNTIGIVGQKYFPVVVALFTYATTTYYTLLQEKLVDFFKKRDTIPRTLRYVIAFLIPLFLSLIITFQDRVSSVALKEQFIVIVSLVSGYLVLIPQKGNINLRKLR